jgi:hypothetical protein
MSAAPKGYAKDQPTGFSNRIERIVIVGVRFTVLDLQHCMLIIVQAGGQLGKHLTEHLVESKKHTVTAITRPNSTNKLPDGVQTVRIDYTSEAESDVSALVDALRGQQVLVITMNVLALSAITNLVRAAAKAGVPYILPNWFGHNAANESLMKDSMMSGLFESVKEIKRLGVSSYFLLVCNFWYEFSLGGGPNRYGFDFKNRSMVLYNDGNVKINTSTWPQCGRAMANLLSLKELPVDDNDKSPTISQFRDQCVYVSSFRLSQRDMFESVKRVTGTTDADWTITHENTEERYKEGLEAVKSGDHKGWMKMGYSRMFFDNGDGDYERMRGLDNELLGLLVEDLDEATKIGIRMGENGEVWP